MVLPRLIKSTSQGLTQRSESRGRLRTLPGRKEEDEVMGI